MLKRKETPKIAFDRLMRYYNNMDTHIELGGTGFPGIIPDISRYLILGEVINVKSN